MPMTEQEWLACTDPMPMLELLRGKVSDRKMRLFAVTCLKKLWALLSDERSRRAVEVVGAYVEGRATDDDMWRVRDEAFEAVRDDIFCSLRFMAADITLLSGLAKIADACLQDLRKYPASDAPAVLLEVFGNPFRPVTVNPAWRTLNVTALAQSIYDNRTFDRLPILADALEDAGCDNADILNHCRQPGEHVRGCWVVDLVLGKE
jgi:hypothetical protein